MTAKRREKRISDSAYVRRLTAVPSDGLIVLYAPDWAKPYVRLSLKRLRRLERAARRQRGQKK